MPTRPVEPQTSTRAAAQPHPSGDNRFKLLEATMKRHQYQPDALIEVLHRAQELFGYLSLDLLLYIANRLSVPPSQVYGVATFYHFFSLAPKGAHTCVVCLGTACYVKGAAALLAAAKQRLGVQVGETTPDQQISLMIARCLGACGIAPTVVFDGVVAGRQTQESLQERLESWAAHGSR
jgi:bidirectional [NiFe] hydrogenase diaphorase subunit